jgi:uncharacterized membrane-anchored protein
MTELRFFKSTIAKYIVIAALPLGVLLFQPAVNFTVLALGERVLLETLPVDPRDFLRGDYVRLGYEISRIPEDFPDADKQERYYGSGGHRVYAELVLDDDGVASLSRVLLERPSGGLYLEGVIDDTWSPSIDYGLGVYYVPEGTGRALEKAISDSGRVLADVRILGGRGVIKELIVKDEAEKR